MSIPVLITVELARQQQALFEQHGFELFIVADPQKRRNFIHENGALIRAVLTNGSNGLDAAAIAGLPNLEIICALGAGYENIDISAARQRGIVITHGPGTNATTVADHAMALLLAIARDILVSDAAVRQGKWVSARQPRPIISGKKLGILGPGNIGEKIARRGADGFGMQVAYHSRQPREGSRWQYFHSPLALAEWADFLVIAIPGGPATEHMVNASVINAVGPQGFIINISRGSVVDTAALTDALQHRWIAGAALDVVEGEPDVPQALTQMTNIILTPHIAGRSPEATAATAELALANLQAWFSGEPVITPVK